MSYRVDIWQAALLSEAPQLPRMKGILGNCEKMIGKLMVPETITILNEITHTPTSEPEHYAETYFRGIF